jgi:polyhydroxybutyrate depolymerase
MKKIFLVCGLIVCIISCDKDDDNNLIIPNNPEIENGLFDKTFTHGGIEREYLLYIPDTYTGTESIPLVFSLHGAGGSKESQYELSQFNILADNENFIIITPQATTAIGNLTFWNQESDPNRADDVDFIDKLIIEINNEYNIDNERIYLAGSSNGAFMALEITCRLSHKIAAVAAIKGYMTPNQISNCNPTIPTAIIQMHGTSDPLVPYQNVNQTLQFWNTFNQTNATAIISAKPDTDPNNGNITNSYLYTNGTNGIEVEHLEVIGGVHDWFGELGTNYDINASEEAWTFFNKFDINGLR